MNAANRMGSISVGQRLGAAAQPLADYWSARNPRERKMIAAAAAAIVLALLYLLLIEPAISGREQLRKNLPALRQQVAQMQSMAREIQAAPPASAASAPLAAPVTRESLEAGLAGAGLKAQTISVSGEFVRLQLNGVSFAALVGWLDQAGKSLGMSVVETSIVAQTQPDSVNANLTLRQQRRE
ncbi:type II secretion system protein GspM [Lacisediminimonas sp.]|uniref:type II secretion system protein GspM n=1 Tax=Lacisediminimonas sp. TaxID=3060582 RepID=UPI00271894FD|nr:type II secretion system protein GspM [Lacisediminimonas sp.]MDO8301225.1 type II secretion system protein GspM [Lacisediminimonas sp.]